MSEAADDSVIVVPIYPGTPRLAWCPSCNLSTLIEVDVLSLTEHGVSVMGTARQCERCRATT